MLHTTEGIVIRTVKYSETSVVCKIYTEALGMQSYIINGVRGPRAGGKGSILQPLSILNLVVYHREHKNLQRIKEFSPHMIYDQIPTDVVRGTLGLFLMEILNKAIIEEADNPDLFQFIKEALIALDQLEKVGNFHLFFLLQLSMHLGFYPQRGIWGSENYFDMNDGVYKADRPTHPSFFDDNASNLMLRLMDSQTVEEAMDVGTNYKVRKVLLGDLLRYFELHLEHFKNIQSHVILDAVFRN